MPPTPPDRSRQPPPTAGDDPPGAARTTPPGDPPEQTQEAPRSTLPRPFAAPGDPEWVRGLVVPGYEVVGELARGGMGVVFAARDFVLGREVAVKTLLPGSPAGMATAARFVREARITARLPYPGIPPAHHLGSLSDGSPFLVMKLIRGRTLADLLQERPSPSADLPSFLRAFERVCEAVGFAHAQGVVHRDLKPPPPTGHRPVDRTSGPMPRPRMPRSRARTTRRGRGPSSGRRRTCRRSRPAGSRPTAGPTCSASA